MRVEVFWFLIIGMCTLYWVHEHHDSVLGFLKPLMMMSSWIIYGPPLARSAFRWFDKTNMFVVTLVPRFIGVYKLCVAMWNDGKGKEGYCDMKQQSLQFVAINDVYLIWTRLWL